MENQSAACLVSGREADADGMCREHGSDACVVTVAVGPAVFDCVIPGFQCTHGHHLRKVEWPPMGAR